MHNKINNLTPAQQRLITEARARDTHFVSTYGIPEKTVQKLADLGLIVKAHEYSDDQRQTIRQEICDLCVALTTMIDQDELAPYHTQATARNIENKTRKLFAMRWVLTEEALDA